MLLDAFWWGVMGNEGISVHGNEDWCCCQYCKNAYQTRFGQDLPEKLDWQTMSSSLVKQCIEWRRDCLEEVYSDIYKKVKAIRPDIAINIHGGPAWYIDAGNLFGNIKYTCGALKYCVQALVYRCS